MDYGQDITYAFVPDSGGSLARLQNKEGYIIFITGPAFLKETGDMILHETLDDLGFYGERTDLSA